MYRLAAACGTGKAALPVVHLSPGRRGFKVADLDVYLERHTQTATRPRLRSTEDRRG
jgi:hypothetical protein